MSARSDRHHHLLPASLLLAAALAIACTPVTPLQRVAEPAAPTPTRSCAFDGVVRSESGAPVEGAVVSANPPGSDPAAVTHTDPHGRYCFETLQAGSYGLTITAPGLTAVYLDVRTIAQGAAIDAQVGGPGFMLRGRAVDDAGAPLAGGRVHIARLSEFLADTFVTTVGVDGRWEAKLPAGRYTSSAQTDRRLSASVEVELDRDRTLDLVAKRMSPKAVPAPDTVVAWIRDTAVPLRTPEPERGLDDLAPLRAWIGDARLVALGEATHGTREFFQLKHRMLELLVEKMGVRSFGIEASFGDCLPLTEYVRTGRGDPSAALANQGFWTWDTEEVLALVKWMRRYNEAPSHTEKLSFWGFDMQSPASSALAVLAHFEAADPAFAKEIAPGLEPLDDDVQAHQVGALPAAEQRALIEVTKKIAARHADAPKGAKTSERDLRLARIHAGILTDASLSADSAARDRAMARIVEDLLGVESLRPAGPPVKMALWAHNGHISKSDNGGAASMGAHLVKRFGGAYFALGFAFDEGSFQAVDMGPEERGLMPFTVASAAPGGLDRTLARAGLPLFALSLRGSPQGPVGDWLTAASYSRSIGSVFVEHQPDYAFFPMVPAAHFDALLFVQKTTAARPNEAGKRERTAGRRAPEKAIEDPGFEAAPVGEPPPGFRMNKRPRQLEFEAKVIDKGCAGGKRCVAMSRVKGDVPTGTGTISKSLDATPYRGKRVRFGASARVEGRGAGDEAFVSVYAFPGPQDAIARAKVPGPAWQKVHVDLAVPEAATHIVLELAVTGVARAGLDDIELVMSP